MYYFLDFWSLTDISGFTSFVPNILCIFWFNLKEIDFNACLVKKFFIHTLTDMESGMLMLMVLDHYVAICYPLCYSSILTNTVIIKFGFTAFSQSVLLTFLVKYLPYCRGNLFHHTYCDLRLWPNCPVAALRLMPSMVSKLPYWLEDLICFVFSCLTPWLSVLQWVCHLQMLTANPSAPVHLSYVILPLPMSQPSSTSLIILGTHHTSPCSHFYSQSLPVNASYPESNCLQSKDQADLWRSDQIVFSEKDILSVS